MREQSPRPRPQALTTHPPLSCPVPTGALATRPRGGASPRKLTDTNNNEHALRDPVTCSPFRGPCSWLPRGTRDATHQKNVIYGKF